MKDSRRIEQLDALRTVAIGSVLLMHVGHYSGVNATPIGSLTAHLNVGVSLFFLLSGFVLYRPFVSALLEGRELPGLLRYAVRRPLRLLPAYWVAFGALAVWPGGMGGLRRYGLWPFLTLLQSFSPHWYLGGIPAAWSLSVEWAFSAALPLFVIWTRALGAGQPPRRLALRAAGLAAGLGVFGLAFRGLGRSAASPLADTMPGYLFYFALGMLLAVSASARAAGLWSGARTFGGGAWGLAGVLYLAHCATFPVNDFAVPLSAWQLVGEELSFGAIVLLLALPAIHGAENPGGVQRLLRARPMVTLGLWSYGVFLWHQPLLIRASRGLELPPPQAFVVLLLGILPVAVLMGWLSHRFVELPSLSLAERWLRAHARRGGDGPTTHRAQ
jgi:peptidoglycan/LPS O-acetylase OafA/YrhL